MGVIAKNARKIYIIVVLMMLVKTFLPIKQLYDNALNILFVLIAIPVAIIEYKVNKRSKGNT
ncbi:hypothetical protein J22TS1_46800 [Siminovitchia terrae]|uniref:Uncharacterized protein n=1 Tax=Siminovitchia terrae TaxID=1914933 RepID=A0A429X9B4_SIMTE|nr:hypothetical protein [Siminovitchia terrae]RST59982.1 hypothetical protein D5F11_009800 [Siminovitchia terrae]GIN93629.1 hypothetical protein J22TS1_46800 [Siminovitchia terrae]